MSTGRPYRSFTFSERRKDTGVSEAYEWQLRRVTMPTGTKGVVCFFNEITSRKEAETTRLRLEVMTASSRKLELEIRQRRKLERALRNSERRHLQSLAESRILQEQLRLLSHEVLKAQEDERRRVSRDLHDVIAQTLTGISLRLANLKTESTDSSPRAFGLKLAQTQRLVLKSVNLVHGFARDLRPAVLDDLGLIPALHSLLKSVAARTGLGTRLTAHAGAEKFDIDRRTVLFRVAQEALTNVVRHAHATRVEVVIAKTPDGFCMTVKDDGQSFSAEDVLRTGGGQHLGLLGMRERLEMVAGRFTIESSPGKGTVITADLPIPKTRTTTNRCRQPGHP